ncbi:MlaD family protein [Pikeienuella sp. HZG-20]|uniref:MlaD family protein n=1 Tax=Paludibacillus litoralis TaxID=3133267 RepID=UPI0030EC05BE
METRANFILIGAFTLMAILGTLGFFIWLANVQIDRQYTTYGILFDDVSGLNPSGDVLFNGISVGKVIDLRIYEKDPARVLATVEINAETPVRVDTVAQLQSQGVTGVAYISLFGGAPDAARLTSSDGELPIIKSRRSTVQTLVRDAPDLLAETMRLLQQFRALTGPENQRYVTNILKNLDASSGRLDQALTDFSSITGTVSDATGQITRFTGRLDRLGASAETTLERADAALASAQHAFDATRATLTSSTAAIDSVEGTFDAAQTILREQVPAILAQVSQVVGQIDSAVADLQSRSGETLDGFGETATLLNARLAEMEQTLRDANTAFAAITGASKSFDTLIVGDGALLVAEARDVLAGAKSAIATIESVVLNDVPVVVADIRGAVATASDAVDRMAADLTGLTGRLDPLAGGAEQALASANALLQRAQISLDALDSALAGAGGALASAETAFDAATTVMTTDLDPVLSDIRAASSRISVAVEDVARDVPAITADLRALIARADAVVAQFQGAVAASAPGVSDFARTGLPELTRLGAEARGLVASLNSLVRRIERDPARFLLNERVPEYRR